MDWGSLGSVPSTSKAAARSTRNAQWAAWGVLALGAVAGAYVQFHLRHLAQAQILIVACLAGFIGLYAMSMVYRETYHRLNDAGR